MHISKGHNEGSYVHKIANINLRPYTTTIITTTKDINKQGTKYCTQTKTKEYNNYQ